MKVINVKQAPELCLTDAFTSSGSRAALLAQANTETRAFRNGQRSLGWRCLEITRESNACHFQ